MQVWFCWAAGVTRGLGWRLMPFTGMAIQQGHVRKLFAAESFYPCHFASAVGLAPKAVNKHNQYLFCPGFYVLCFTATFCPVLTYQKLSHLLPWSYCNYSVISDIRMKLLNIQEGLENQIQWLNNYIIFCRKPPK